MPTMLAWHDIHLSIIGSNTMAWELNGNSGTNPSNNFLGTTDGQPLVLKANGTEAFARHA